MFNISCRKVDILGIRFTVLRMIMIGKTADVTVVQRTLNNTLYEHGKPQKVTAERQRAVSQHLHGKVTGREKCVGKMCTSNWENLSGHQEPPCIDVFRKWLQVLHF